MDFLDVFFALGVGPAFQAAAVAGLVAVFIPANRDRLPPLAAWIFDKSSDDAGRPPASGPHRIVLVFICVGMLGVFEQGDIQILNRSHGGLAAVLTLLAAHAFLVIWAGYLVRVFRRSTRP